MASFTLNNIEQLLAGLRPASNSAFSPYRADAETRLKGMGFPTQKQEEWRFINLKPLLSATLNSPSGDAAATGYMEVADANRLGALTQHNLYFVDGVLRTDLSQIDKLPDGITVTPLNQEESNPFVTENFGTVAKDQKHPFLALNSSLFNDGLFVHIGKNVQCAAPIHIINVISDHGSATLVNPRVLVIAEEESSATIIESYVGPDGVAYLSNPVSEFVIKSQSNIDHYRLQLDGNESYHTATLDARQEKDSRFSTQTFTFGGKLTRNDTGLHMDGANGYGVMNGVYHISDSQVVDNHTRIDHAYPNCETHELFKGVLDGHARGVFNGSIMVRQIAQKTDSKQTNRTLLLSSDALINTNPQLEIFADDVKCTHGATIGQIEETQLYYLRSRGISEKEARRILVFAFANDVVEKVAYEPLKNYLEERLLQEQANKAELV